MRSALSQVVSELVASGTVSAASALIGDANGPLAEAHGGWRFGARADWRADWGAGRRDEARKQPVGRYDRFDLASLTKLWTATLALALDQRGTVPLSLALGEVWPNVPSPLARRALVDLLRHRSGLLAWRPLYRQLRSPERVAERLLSPDTLGAPRPTYSDLGYILWARAAEEVTGDSMTTLLRRRVLRPLGVSTVDTAPEPRRSVASLLGNDREIDLAAALGVAVARLQGPPRGVAQDGNARFLGGLPGHAGLFAPARALWRLGSEWLRPSRVLTADSVSMALAGRGRYALGWWRRSAAPAATGPLGTRSYGHHGFTGGSVWMDLERGRVAVLLAHRLASEVDLDPWRGRIHQLAVA